MSAFDLIIYASNKMAAPCPTPTHMVARPYFTPRFFISCNKVVDIRTPLHPRGWPNAMAPPFTLTFAGSRPSSRIQAMDCEAKASFNSTRSTSFAIHISGSAEFAAQGASDLAGYTGCFAIICGDKNPFHEVTIHRAETAFNSAIITMLGQIPG